MPFTPPRSSAAVLPVALALLAAACSGSGHPKARPDVAATNLPAMVDRALADLAAHSSVHLVMTGPDVYGDEETANLRVEAAGSVGSVTSTVDGERVRAQLMEVSGVSYVRGARFFALSAAAQVGAAAAARAESRIGDHWVKVSADLLGKKVPLTLPSLVKQLRPDASYVPYPSGPNTGPTSIGGHPVLGVSVGENMYWITTGASPEILRAVHASYDGRDTLVLTDFDEPLILTPPTDALDPTAPTGASGA